MVDIIVQQILLFVETVGFKYIDENVNRSIAPLLLILFSLFVYILSLSVSVGNGKAAISYFFW